MDYTKNMDIKKILALFILLGLNFFATAFSFSKNQKLQTKTDEPENLYVFKKAYPEVEFKSEYDTNKNDYLISVFTKKDGTTSETKLYWCESRFLPENQIQNKEKYRKMLYKYQSEPKDPKTFTPEEIEQIKNFTSKENRTNGAIDPPFLYNAIYDCKTRASTESHIISIPFLTKTINIHEKIAEPLKRVSKKIMSLPKDEEISDFFATLTRTDGFNWRSVRDTQSRSFHSVGLAIDILPKGYYQRIIYWAWQKQLRPNDWFMTPLEKRWAPPKKIIEIFAEEGFIWGGTWIVWDNMHFEYHPELLIYAKQ